MKDYQYAKSLSWLGNADCDSQIVDDILLKCQDSSLNDAFNASSQGKGLSVNTPTVFIPSHQDNGPNISSVFKPILSASGTNITSQCQDNVDTCCKENRFSGNGNSVSTPLRLTLDSNCSNDLLSFSIRIPAFLSFTLRN